MNVIPRRVGPLMPWLLKVGASTEQMGRAMLKPARHGGPKATLENGDINGV